MTTAPTSDDAAAPTGTSGRHAALLAAYTAHLAEHGRRPGVRALRERARVSTDAAATWLKEHAPERRAPEIPAERLAPVLEPLWAAAVDAASQVLQEDHQATLAAHLESEQQALQDAERATTQAQQQADRAAEAESRAEALTREVVTSQQEAHRAREQAHEVGEAAAEIRERAQQAIHQAEQAAAVARAEAAALREALAAVRPTTDPTQEEI
jgi:flagellar biosynthesis GTPase FlhF